MTIALQIAYAALLFGFMLLWLLYLIEAFGQSPLQGILTLLVPLYVYYFMFIKSARSKSLGLLMVLFSFLLILTATAKVVVSLPAATVVFIGS